LSKKTKATKEKKKHKKLKLKSTEGAAAKASAPKAASAAYDDGVPFDQITYIEAKLILKPDRFVSVDAFRQFGKLVQRTAKRLGVGFIVDREAGLRPQVREIVFVDTPDFQLYKNAFILRRRISYVDGFPVGDPEIVFKYRHPEEVSATAVDVRPRIAGKYRIKFKAEVLPLKDAIGGYRILYSHNSQFGASQVHEGDPTSMTSLTKMFPPLAKLKAPGEERVKLVNGGIVEEVLLPLGQLDFGKGLVAKCDVSLWRTRGEHKSLVGEFAFQAKFATRAEIAQKQKKLAAQFYVSLQRDVQDWLQLGCTKTAMVYRLNGNEPQSHE
jgi:hypothetical protein